MIHLAVTLSAIGVYHAPEFSDNATKKASSQNRKGVTKKFESRGTSYSILSFHIPFAPQPWQSLAKTFVTLCVSAYWDGRVVVDIDTKRSYVIS